VESHGNDIVRAVERHKRNLSLIEDAHDPQRVVELGQRVVDAEARDNLAKGPGRLGHTNTVPALYTTHDVVKVAARYVANLGKNLLAGAASIGKDHNGAKPGAVADS
jgi:hypothetical protein